MLDGAWISFEVEDAAYREDGEKERLSKLKEKAVFATNINFALWDHDGLTLARLLRSRRRTSALPDGGPASSTIETYTCLDLVR